MNPTVTVIIPSFNYRHLIGMAVQSVLDQTYRDFELVIVEDGSTDGSLEWLKGWEERFPDKIRVVTHPGHTNRGIVESYQRGFHEARGAIVAFLEADDFWHPQNLEKKVQVLDRDPSVGVVYSRYRPFGHLGGRIYWTIYEWANAAGIPAGRRLDLMRPLLCRNPLASFSHFIVRRELLAGIPPLKTMRGNFDWWLLAHLSVITQFYRLPDTLCFWRIHKKSAGFGSVDKRMLWRLKGFLARLHISLWTLCRKKPLAQGLQFYRSLDGRKMGRLAFHLLLHPFATLRFLCYIVLRRLLLST